MAKVIDIVNGRRSGLRDIRLWVEPELFEYIKLQAQALGRSVPRQTRQMVQFAAARMTIGDQIEGQPEGTQQ
jgi:hypothetical protein